MTPKFCPECGVKAPSIAAKFCTSCGNSLDMFAQKTKASTRPSRVASSNIDEDDEDGSDLFELPNISSLKVKIETDEYVGFNSFSFGADGFEPVKYTSKRR